MHKTGLSEMAPHNTITTHCPRRDVHGGVTFPKGPSSIHNWRVAVSRVFFGFNRTCKTFCFNSAIWPGKRNVHKGHPEVEKPVAMAVSSYIFGQQKLPNRRRGRFFYPYSIMNYFFERPKSGPELPKRRQ
jgi:hypothetical protein